MVQFLSTGLKVITAAQARLKQLARAIAPAAALAAPGGPARPVRARRSLHGAGPLYSVPLSSMVSRCHPDTPAPFGLRTRARQGRALPFADEAAHLPTAATTTASNAAAPRRSDNGAPLSHVRAGRSASDDTHAACVASSVASSTKAARREKKNADKKSR